MRSLDQQLNYEHLELIARPSSSTPAGVQEPQARLSILKQAASFLQTVAAMTMQQLTRSHEPRIWTSIIKSGPHAGQTQWHVYDPLTHHRAVLSSETDVRVWLDQRYYC